MTTYCIKKMVMLVVISSAFLIIQADKKHVIGVTHYQGFFSAFFSTLNGILWCYEQETIPTIFWDNHFLYYEPAGYNNESNGWNYYFEPLNDLTPQAEDNLDRVYHFPHNTIITDVFAQCSKTAGHLEIRKRAKAFIDKHVILKGSIQRKIETFFQKYMANKYTIGIHLRGTDKESEYKSAPPEELIARANTYVCDQFLVCTDEEKLLELAKKLLHKPVIYYPSHRASNNQPLHFNESLPKAVLGEEVLIEARLLALCKNFIHTVSNVSLAVLCFNPELDNYVFVPQSPC